MHMWTSAVRTRPRGFEYLELYERNPKLRLLEGIAKLHASRKSMILPSAAPLCKCLPDIYRVSAAS